MSRYINTQVFSPRLTSPPIEFIGKGLEQLQNQFDTNFMYADQIRNKYISALDVDRARANELQNEYEASVDSVVKKYSGDYSKATKDLYTLKSRIDKDFNPGGEGYTIQNNFNAYNEAVKQNQKLFSEGKIVENQMRLWKENLDKNYKGAIKKDDGTFESLPLENISQFPKDIEKTLTDLAIKAPKRKITVEEEVPDGKGFMVKKFVEKEVVNKEALGDMVENALTQNPEYVSYLSQMARWQGKDPATAIIDTTRDYVDSYSELYGGITSYTEKQGLSSDPVYLAKYNAGVRFQLQAREHAYRKAAEDRKNAREDAETEGQDKLSLLAPVNRKYDSFKPVDRGFFTGTWPSVNAVLNTKDSKYDLNLLKTINAANPGKADGDKWTIYNNTLANAPYNGGMYYRPFETTVAMNEEAKRKIPTMLSTSTDVYEIENGKVKQLTGQEIADAHSNLWDKQNNKPTGTALGKSSVINGQIPFGTVVTDTNGKTYVIGEADERARQTSRQAKNLLSFMDSPSTEFGPVEAISYQVVDDSGKRNTVDLPIIGAKYREYDPVSQSVKEEARFYLPKQDASGNMVPDMDNLLTKPDGTPWEQQDIEAAMFGEKWNSYYPKKPRGASSKEEVPMEDYNN